MNSINNYIGISNNLDACRKRNCAGISGKLLSTTTSNIQTIKLFKLNKTEIVCIFVGYCIIAQYY